MPGNCLFIKASATACGGEVQIIKDTLTNLHIDLNEIEWISQTDFLGQLADGRKYNLIYLGAHADSIGFGEREGWPLNSWEQFGTAICQSDCMVPEATLFLGCCRGGMKTVALKIMKMCDKIDYICGPNWNVTGNDLAAAFQAFAQSRIRRNEEPAVAAERASEATGRRFSSYDRQDLQAEIEMLRQIQSIEWEIGGVRDLQFTILREFREMRANLSTASSPKNVGNSPANSDAQK